MTVKLTPTDVDDLIERYQAGESQNQLAAAFEVTQGTVSRWIIKRGAQISRSDAEARKWAAMTAEQRAAQVASAHEAVRGMVRTDEDLERRALGKYRTQAHATPEERMLANWLRRRGHLSWTQWPVGRYNVDVAVRAGSVAVELFGGGWHAHGDHRERLPQRTRDLADAGWNLLIIWTHKAHPLSPKVTDEMVSYIERSRSDPAFRRQYRVIWGDGQLIAAGCVDDDELTLVPTGVRGTYSRT